MTKAEKEADAAIGISYRKFGNGVQVNMMDIPRIFREAREVLARGEAIDQHMPGIIAKYRKN
jgi:hypothetical protein